MYCLLYMYTSTDQPARKLTIQAYKSQPLPLCDLYMHTSQQHDNSYIEQLLSQVVSLKFHYQCPDTWTATILNS